MSYQFLLSPQLTLVFLKVHSHDCYCLQFGARADTRHHVWGMSEVGGESPMMHKQSYHCAGVWLVDVDIVCTVTIQYTQERMCADRSA